MMAILDTLSTRLKSPYFGSFALAWVGSTWQVWYVTLFVSVSELPRIPGMQMRYTDKLSYIWSLELGWCRLLVFPVLFGFVTPWALHYVEGWLTYRRKKVDQHWADEDKTAFGEGSYVTKKELSEQAEQLDEALRDMDRHRNNAFKLRKKLQTTQKDLTSSRDGAFNLQEELFKVKEENEQMSARLKQVAIDERKMAMGEAYYSFVVDHVSRMILMLKSLTDGTSEVNEVVILLEELQGIQDRVSLSMRKKK